MKCTYTKLLLIATCSTALHQSLILSLNFGSIASTVSKGVEIAGHVASGVDVAMNIASVGVTLWGSDADKERMAKGLGITSMITSIARGDFESAEAHAAAVRGKPETSGVYSPLTAEELADADIVPAPERPVTRSLGDINQMSANDLDRLRKNEKIITINDTKVAQFGILKNQLVFEAQLPQNPNEEKLYQLMNGVEILFQAASNTKDSSKLNIICYRIHQANKPAYGASKQLTEAASKLFTINGLKGSPATKTEFVTIALPKAELSKPFFFGTTNNELSVFHKEGNDIIKTTLIPKMIE